MPFPLYGCNVCRTRYATHAEAARCEQKGHRSFTVWPSSQQAASAAATNKTAFQSRQEGKAS